MIDTISLVLSYWQEVVVRCLGQGSVTLAGAWIIDRLWTTMPTAWRSWLWRLALTKVVLFSLVPIAWRIPILPPRAAFVVHANSGAVPDSRHPGNANPSSHLATPGAAPRHIASLDRTINPLGASIVSWPALLFVIWVVVCFLLCCRWQREHRRLWERVCRAKTTWDPTLRAEMAAMATRFGLSRVPELVISDEFCSPCLTVSRRPVIAIPANWPGLFDLNALRIMLAHELAHYVRRDLAWNRLVSAVWTCFFFHPLVWLAARRYAAAQEIACDAIALAKTQGNANQLARLLVAGLESVPHTFLPGAASFDGALSLLRERILAMHRQSLAPSGILRWLMVFGTALFLTPWSLAEQTPSKESLSTETPRYDGKSAEKRNGIRVSASASAGGSASGFSSGLGMGDGASEGASPEFGENAGAASATDPAMSNASRARNLSRLRARSRSAARSLSRSRSQSNAKSSVAISGGPDSISYFSANPSTSDDDSESQEGGTLSGSTRHRLNSRQKPATWQRSAQSEDDERRISVEERHDGITVTITARATDEEKIYQAKDLTELESKSPDAAQAYRELLGDDSSEAAMDGADAQELLREHLRQMRQQDGVRGSQLESMIDEMERQIEK